MKKICRYDKNNWLMQDEDKNLLVMNEQTNQIFNLQSFIQPERLSPKTFEKINCVVGVDSSYIHDERLYKRSDSLNSMET